MRRGDLRFGLHLTFAFLVMGALFIFSSSVSAEVYPISQKPITLAFYNLGGGVLAGGSTQQDSPDSANTGNFYQPSAGRRCVSLYESAAQESECVAKCGRWKGLCEKEGYPELLCLTESKLCELNPGFILEDSRCPYVALRCFDEEDES